MSFSVVIPTSGRPSLAKLLDALAAGRGPMPERIVLVDDRPEDAEGGVSAAVPERLRPLTCVVRGGARGPAAARNLGWRACRSEWIAFLDDDVVPERGWRAELAADLAAVGPRVGAVQGQIRVPRPPARRPTDWERNVAGLECAHWATADMAYRRAALAEVGGFDERFPRAYREDTDLGLRVTAAGWSIVRGRRAITHPVGPASWRVSIHKQAGNADDALMDALHGPGWRERGGAHRGRRRGHVATAGAGMTALACAGAGRAMATCGRQGDRTSPMLLGWRAAAAASGAAWAALTAEFAWKRIAPGPRTAREVATMAVTSAVMPFTATAWWLRGRARAPRLAAAGMPGPRPLPEAVLFDRDDTLVVDVPYNGDPARVEPVPGAREALDRLRAAGVAIGVVSNQSGVARGLLTDEDVRAVNARAEELLGSVGTWQYCPHGPEDGCDCRKPAPGIVRRAAAALGTTPERCVVVGDIGADVGAALAAGARAVLVPTPRTLREEVDAAPQVAPDLTAAVDMLLGSPAATEAEVDFVAAA